MSKSTLEQVKESLDLHNKNITALLTMTAPCEDALRSWIVHNLKVVTSMLDETEEDLQKVRGQSRSVNDKGAFIELEAGLSSMVSAAKTYLAEPSIIAAVETLKSVSVTETYATLMLRAEELLMKIRQTFILSYFLNSKLSIH